MFKLLLRHFVTRFFSSEAEEREDDAGGSIAPVLALLTIPGTLLTVTLLPKYSSLIRWFDQNFKFDPVAATVADKYVFLALTVTAIGLATVLRWETLFPDRRDYVNLAPLPIPTLTLFGAKFAGLLIYIAAVAVTTNLVPFLAFPAIAMENRGGLAEIARFYASHAIATTAASAFSFFTVLAVAGLVMDAGRLRRMAQLVLLALFLAGFFLAPVASPAMREFPMIPVVWYLGLYQELQGQPYPWTGEAAGRALPALAIVMALSAAAWLLRFRRFCAHATQVAPRPGSPGRLIPGAYQLLDRLLPGPFHQASLRFSLKTLARNDRHTAMIAAALGTGISIALAFATAGMLSPFAFVVSFSLLAAIRISFGLPVHTKANWVFAIALSERNPDLAGAGRNVMVLAAAALSVSLALPYGWVAWGPAEGLAYAVFVFVPGALLAELMTKSIRTPLHTMTLIPGRENPVFALALAAMCLLLYAVIFSTIFLMCRNDVARICMFLALSGAGYVILRSQWQPEEPIVGQRLGAFELLRLSE